MALPMLDLRAGAGEDWVLQEPVEQGGEQAQVQDVRALGAWPSILALRFSLVFSIGPSIPRESASRFIRNLFSGFL